MREILREFVDSRGLKIGINRSTGMIRGVKILGTESRNGRTYLPEAIRDAASLYEGAKVNINHNQKTPSLPRDYRDRIGIIRNVAVREGDGLFADFHFNPKHELAEQFLWDAEHAPENVGFSHNVVARTAREGDRVLIKKILKVQSVDLVADPATTNGLFESVENLGEKTSEKAVPPEGGGKESAVLDELTEARDRLREECERLKGELDELRGRLLHQQRRHQIEQLFLEAGLPLPGSEDPLAELTSPSDFIESLLKIDDQRTVREQIYHRAELVKRAGHTLAPGKNKTLAQERVPFALPERPENTESFLKAITL